MGELGPQTLLGLDRVYSPAWFNKVDEDGCAAEHLAPAGSRRTPRSHDTVPFCSTCWSDLGQQMFQLHSVPKSMTIDLG